MEDALKERMTAAFDAMSNREKNQALHELSQPWLKKGAIDCVVSNLDQLFKLMEKSEQAEIKAAKMVRSELDHIRGHTRFTFHKYKKKRRK